MAASKTFPLSGVAHRVRVQFFTAATGAPFTGTLTTLAATVNQNDGTLVATTNAPVQVGTSSIAYVDLTAAEMTGTTICVLFTCGNSGVYSAMVEQNTGGVNEIWAAAELGESAIRATTVGQQLAFLYRKFWNQTETDGYTMRIKNDAGSATLVSAPVSYSNGLATRGGWS